MGNAASKNFVVYKTYRTKRCLLKHDPLKDITEIQRVGSVIDPRLEILHEGKDHIIKLEERASLIGPGKLRMWPKSVIREEPGGIIEIRGYLDLRSDSSIVIEWGAKLVIYGDCEIIGTLFIKRGVQVMVMQNKTAMIGHYVFFRSLDLTIPVRDFRTSTYFYWGTETLTERDLNMVVHVLVVIKRYSHVKSGPAPEFLLSAKTKAILKPLQQMTLYDILLPYVKDAFNEIMHPRAGLMPAFLHPKEDEAADPLAVRQGCFQ